MTTHNKTLQIYNSRKYILEHLNFKRNYDTSEYEGGDFEFDEVKTTADFRSKGTVLVFPSYLRHRVLPVTSGIRRSLVAWFVGPRWK